jgi:hypothetical protein
VEKAAAEYRQENQTIGRRQGGGACAGRRYPNLVDNMWAAKRKKDRGVEAD